MKKKDLNISFNINKRGEMSNKTKKRRGKNKYCVYINIDNIDLEALLEKYPGTYHKTHISLYGKKAMIYKTGKIIYEGSINDLLKTVKNIGDLLKTQIKIIAYGQELRNGRYLVFCPYIPLSLEIVRREICEIFYSLNLDLPEQDILKISTELANEIVSDVFFREDISLTFSTPFGGKEFNGLMIIDDKLKNLLMIKVFQELKEGKLNIKQNDPWYNKIKEKLVKYGIEITVGVLTGLIVELIIRFVISKPLGLPCVVEYKVPSLKEGRILAERKVISSKEIASLLGKPECMVIPALNTLVIGGAAIKIDPIERIYKLTSQTYITAAGMFISSTSEYLSTSQIFRSFIEGPTIISATSEKHEGIIERPKGIPKLKDVADKEKMSCDEEVYKQLISKFIT